MKQPDINVLINIDFYNLDLWTFLGRGWGSERNVQRTFLVTKSICESYPLTNVCKPKKVGHVIKYIRFVILWKHPFLDI